jgi:RNA polymerase sigma-70 factor (ECF subfamily)
MTIKTRPQLPAAPFLTTKWTRVCLAKADSEDGKRALADLCNAYYEPVVAYLKSVLRDADAARDMSRAFFSGMLAGGRIHTADAGRGRFRSYLLGAVKHFLSHQRQAAEWMKRGGNAEVVMLDDAEAADVPDTTALPPDAEFDRQWAMTVIARSLDSLRSDCVAEGRGEFFDAVSSLLSGPAGHGDQATLAVRCGMSFDAFRMAVSRLKKRLRQHVKAEVAGTLDNPCSAPLKVGQEPVMFRRLVVGVGCIG